MCWCLLSLEAAAEPQAARDPWPALKKIYPELRELYVDLHRNPELAFQEKRTASVLAARLKALGFEVTTGVGRTGVVGLLRNGAGPVVMLRTELDALPTEEKSGLAYASRATGVGADGSRCQGARGYASERIARTVASTSAGVFHRLGVTRGYSCL